MENAKKVLMAVVLRSQVRFMDYMNSIKNTSAR